MTYSSDAYFIKNSSGNNKLIICDFNSETETARLELVSAELNSSSYLGDVWTDISTVGGTAQEGGVVLKNGKKPEKLLKRIIETCSKNDDIVLEQMDYIETLAKKRLENVVSGDQTGISKDVNWRGGGSFVYMELKKYNQDFLDRLMEVTSISDVEEVYADMQKNAFLKFFFDKKEFEKDENFRSKTWEQRRNMLVDILDENQLYLNLLDMRDTKYKVTNDEMALTERFYGVQEDAEN